MQSSLPVFVAPAAMAKMVHEDGERGIARGCKEKGIIQCVSNNASFPVEEIIDATPEHPFFFQLYVNRNRAKSEALLRQVWDLGIRTVFLTVDAPVSGKREADERVKADESLNTPMSSMKATNDKRGGGLGRIMGSYIDSSLNWKDLEWLRRAWKGKIVIKGVQTAADAIRAVKEGLDGIVIRYAIFHILIQGIVTYLASAIMEVVIWIHPHLVSSSSLSYKSAAPKSSITLRFISTAASAVALTYSKRFA